MKLDFKIYKCKEFNSIFLQYILLIRIDYCIILTLCHICQCFLKNNKIFLTEFTSKHKYITR